MSEEQQVGSVNFGETTLSNSPHYSRHPDDEWVDEIKLEVVPRYKESELSGDEWRVSTKISIFRKGHLLHEETCGDIDTASGMLYAVLVGYRDKGIDHGPFTRLC